MPDVIKDGNSVQSPVGIPQQQMMPQSMGAMAPQMSQDQFISPINMMGGGGSGMPLGPSGISQSPQLPANNILPNSR